MDPGEQPHTSRVPERAPPEPLVRLFLRYLRFGLNAWGGPVAQIAMVRRELVDERRWVSPERFNRTLAVYQALPGPEAHELCVHYGMESRGRAGAVLAGLGFMLPGFVLMFALSWVYVTYGLGSGLAVALLAGFRPAVVALIVRAVHQLGAHAFRGAYLLAVGASSAVATFLGAPFFLVLPLGGLAYALARRGRPGFGVGAAILLVGAFGGLYAAQFVGPSGVESVVPDALSGGPAPGALALFGSGLKAGLLTFGGAYTAIPFLRDDATGPGGWMTDAQFLEGVALGGILPAPLVIFSTFVGYLGGGPWGALTITLGMFLPAFAFTVVGYRWLGRAVNEPRLHDFLDGVTAAVIGLVAVTGLALLLAAVRDIMAGILFAASLAALYAFRSRAAVPLVVLGSGVAGVLLSWLP